MLLIQKDGLLQLASILTGSKSIIKTQVHENEEVDVYM
jgi:hypothetical protein